MELSKVFQDIVQVLKIKSTVLRKETSSIILEPEGWNTVEIYVNGFSSSLPEDVQLKAITSCSWL